MNEHSPGVVSDGELKRLLHAPQAPHDLEQTLLDTLDAQTALERSGADKTRLVLGLSLVANLVLTAWLLGTLFMPAKQAPDFVADAFAHLEHETHLSGMLDVSYPNWLPQRQMATPPEGFRFDMAKICDIDNMQVKHLRYHSPTHGNINLIVYPSAYELPEKPRQGTLDNQRWVALRIDPQLSALMFYDANVTSDQAQKLITSMFPRFNVLSF